MRLLLQTLSRFFFLQECGNSYRVQSLGSLQRGVAWQFLLNHGVTLNCGRLLRFGGNWENYDRVCVKNKVFFRDLVWSRSSPAIPSNAAAWRYFTDIWRKKTSVPKIIFFFKKMFYSFKIMLLPKNTQPLLRNNLAPLMEHSFNT